MTKFIFTDKQDAGIRTTVQFNPEADKPFVEGEKYQGKLGQVDVMHSAFSKTILVGIGKSGKLDEKSVRGFAAPILKALAPDGAKRFAVQADRSDVSPAQAAHLADALLNETYEFKKYKTVKDDSAPANPEEITIVISDPAKASEIFESLRKVTDSVFWASDLVNEPANVLNPDTYAERIERELTPLGVGVDVLDETDMKREGMNLALAVGGGSATPPRMVIMRYFGADDKNTQPVALVGKGITFDSGGISIKPSGDMGDMTMDMGGSAAVVGAMRALAARKANVNAVAIVALAENMPGSRAYRPGDIITSMSGKTVYIDNTDAEGRLVLADALTYIQRATKPHTVIDAATLTGAIMVALGHDIAGIYANDDALSGQFNKASAATGEKTWRMPLDESFAKVMRKTPHADLTNSGSRYGGSCAAAGFLREFIEKDADGKDKCNWVHIDMAGPGITKAERKGWGVRLLNQIIADNFEAKAAPAPVAPGPAAPAVPGA